MKYLIFTVFLLGTIPMAFLLQFNRRWTTYAIAFLTLPIMFFDSVSINFFSHELYRGTSRGMEISLIYLVAFTLLLSLTFRQGLFDCLPTPGCKLYILYVLLSLPSFLTAANRLFSFFELWKMLMMWCLFLAVYHYLVYYRDFNMILLCFGVLTACCFFTVAFQHIRGIHQAHGFFPHQNSLGMYMSLLGTLFLSYYMNHPANWRRWPIGLCFLLAGACAARTYSRGTLLCFPLGCAVTVAVSLLYQFNIRKLRMLVPLGVAGLLGCLLLLPNIIKRFETAPKESLQTRQVLAASAWNMIKDKPLCGVGLNNWGIKINPPYPYCDYRYISGRYPKDFKEGIVETIYLLVGAECGIPGMLALLIWLGYYFFLSLRLLPILKGSTTFYLPAGMVGGLTAAYLQSALEWVLKQQVNFMQLMILFAMLSYLNLHKRRLAQHTLPFTA